MLYSPHTHLGNSSLPISFDFQVVVSAWDCTLKSYFHFKLFFRSKTSVLYRVSFAGLPETEKCILRNVSKKFFNVSLSFTDIRSLGSVVLIVEVSLIAEGKIKFQNASIYNRLFILPIFVHLKPMNLPDSWI